MTILDTELKSYLSEVVNDGSTNGGRMDNTAQVVSGVLNNVWPSVFRAERLAGSTKYRKTFMKVANDDDDTLYNPLIFLDRITPGDDWVVLFEGTQTDTQNDITGSEDCYGCSSLNTNVTAGGATVVVDVEDASLAPGGADVIFRDGDSIRITNKDTPDSAVGTEEIQTISGTPTVVGTTVTITIAGTLSNDYNTDDNTYGTRVMSLMEPSDIVSSYDSAVVTTAGDGDIDEVGNPILADNIGSIEQTITITFTGASTFTAASNVAGVSLTGGSTSGDYAPSNPDVSKPYFTLPSGLWTGTWASGDTLVFDTHPASAPVWRKRVIPAAASSLSSNRSVVAFTGEAV